MMMMMPMKIFAAVLLILSKDADAFFLDSESVLSSTSSIKGHSLEGVVIEKGNSVKEVIAHGLLASQGRVAAPRSSYYNNRNLQDNATDDDADDDFFSVNFGDIFTEECNAAYELLWEDTTLITTWDALDAEFNDKLDSLDVDTDCTEDGNTLDCDLSTDGTLYEAHEQACEDLDADFYTLQLDLTCRLAIAGETGSVKFDFPQTGECLPKEECDSTEAEKVFDEIEKSYIEYVEEIFLLAGSDRVDCESGVSAASGLGRMVGYALCAILGMWTMLV